MGDLLQAVASWQALVGALILFGFAPGVALRTILLIYPRSHPRRAELIGELYCYPRWERPFWVAEQLEVAIFEGLPGRRKNTLRQLRALIGRRFPPLPTESEHLTLTALAAARRALDADARAHAATTAVEEALRLQRRNAEESLVRGTDRDRNPI